MSGLMGGGHSHGGSAAAGRTGRLTLVLAITVTILAPRWQARGYQGH
jgi:hypothetical protein